LLVKLFFLKNGEDELFSVQSGSGKDAGDNSKNDFFSFVNAKDRELAKRARIEQTSSIGVSGFIEVLKRGAVEPLRKEERLTRKVTLMDRLMAEISKDEGVKAVYGYEEVKKALVYGAIESLMVCDEKLMAPEMEEGEGRREKGEGGREKGEGRRANG